MTPIQRDARPAGSSPGIAFLACGVAFLAVGWSRDDGSLLSMGPAFLALGIVFLARARRAARHHRGN